MGVKFKCLHDCEHCVYVNDDDCPIELTAEEYAMSKALDTHHQVADLSEEAARRKAYETARSKAYYDAHRDEKRAYFAAYNAAHRDELRAYRKAYYATHKDVCKTYQKAYRAAHKDAYRAYSKAYYAAHKSEISARRNKKPAGAVNTDEPVKGEK